MRTVPTGPAVTVIGGYLGAGKTTLLNTLLARTGSRRLGVVVNDFGELGIDAAMVASSTGAVDVVDLPNGCVCCTLGDDLRETLFRLAAVDPPLDEVVIEASGVADPATTAAWGSVAPFVPGGIVVVVAADTIRTRLRDRYVGGEVRRQVEGAGLVLLSKVDRCTPLEVADACSVIGSLTSAPVVEVVAGDIDPDLVLGPRPGRDGDQPDDLGDDDRSRHVTDRYVRWSRIDSRSLDRSELRAFLDALPDGVLRLKGWAALSERSGRVGVVNVVGAAVDLTERDGDVTGIRLEAIGIADLVDVTRLDDLADRYLSPAAGPG